MILATDWVTAQHIAFCLCRLSMIDFLMFAVLLSHPLFMSVAVAQEASLQVLYFLL
ncbi:hypothetical protein SALWKB29_1346 [Snodgrassella communis]|uniref:Uncharacterized protein n=1 Tax=Snodgrassella communis TaxID=2946699 RepID=A0A836MPA3_9NEIS|nr:hypothetical protein SALWKB29_1346 [Snodgrassella communis]